MVEEISGTNREFGVDGPLKYRYRNAGQVYEMFYQFYIRDPQLKKRGNIQKQYYRYPEPVTSRDMECAMVKPARSNYGQLAYLVDQQKSIYIDMVIERETAFKIKSEYKSKQDYTDNNKRKEWSKRITWAFERYAIKPWQEYLLNMETDIQDMLLFGKGIEYWDSPTGYRSKHLSTEYCLPNPESKIIPSTFDTLFVRKEYYNWQLWEKATAPGSKWSKEGVIALIQMNNSNYLKNETPASLIQRFEDGTIDYYINNRTSRVVEAYVREYDKNGGDKMITKMVIGEQFTPYTDEGPLENAGEDAEKVGFLYWDPYSISTFDHVVSTMADNVGHGSYHFTPSFAEMVYVQCREYNELRNSAHEAQRINNMFMVESRDSNVGQKLKRMRFRDHMAFDPGTAPAQVKYLLPAEQSISLSNAMMADLYRGIASYQVGSTSGGKTPPTAAQVQADASLSSRIQSSGLKRFNQQLTFWGKELYRRWINEMSPAEEGWEDRQKFDAYLDEYEVPKKARDPENVLVESNMNLGAGAPAYREAAALRTIELLNLVPRDEGQAQAQKDAIIALNGISNIDQYINVDREDVPQQKDRIPGWENELLRNEDTNPENVQVFPNDDHLKHLQIHTTDTSIAVQSAAQLVEVLQNDQVQMSDPDIIISDVNKILVGVQNEIAHAQAHNVFLQRDQSKEQEATQYSQILNQFTQEVIRLTNQLQAIKEQRAQQAGPQMDPELQKKAMLAQIEVESKKQIADIKAAEALERGQVQRENAQLATENKIQIARREAAQKLAAEAQKTAQQPIEPVEND